MRPFNFVKSIILALLLAIIGTGAYAALSIALVEPVAFKLTIALLAVLYAGTLIMSASEHIGRIVVPFVWLLVTAVSASLLSSPVFLIEQIGLIWLVRSLYFHNGPLTALADLGLTSCAFGAAVWASSTGSWFMMIWSFFLVQSLVALIPQRQPADSIIPTTHPDDFQRAREQAHAALKKLVSY
jgi:hypothetical protein